MPCLHSLWIHRFKARNRRLGKHSSKSVSNGSFSDSSVLVLRQETRPNQGVILGGRRIPSVIQTIGKRQLPMAANQGRSANIDASAVPVAHGRLENRTAKSKQNHDWIECNIMYRNIGKRWRFNSICGIITSWKTKRLPQVTRKW